MGWLCLSRRGGFRETAPHGFCSHLLLLVLVLFCSVSWRSSHLRAVCFVLPALIFVLPGLGVLPPFQLLPGAAPRPPSPGKDGVCVLQHGEHTCNTHFSRRHSHIYSRHRSHHPPSIRLCSPPPPSLAAIRDQHTPQLERETPNPDRPVLHCIACTTKVPVPTAQKALSFVHLSSRACCF